MSEIEKLYQRYGSLVLRRAERLLGSPDAARDVMQEVFVSIIKSQSTFRGAASPSTWLYAITTNLCLQQLRDSKSRSAKLQQPDAEHSGLGRPSRPEADAWSMLRQALSTLPDELCQIAIHFYVDQMSHEEIAELMNVSRRTIGNRLESFHQAARAAGLKND